MSNIEIILEQAHWEAMAANLCKKLRQEQKKLYGLINNYERDKRQGPVECYMDDTGALYYRLIKNISPPYKHETQEGIPHV